MDDMSGIKVGSQHLSPSGRVWTVRSITPKGARLLLVSADADGECGAVMDAVAVGRMVALAACESRASDRAAAEPLSVETPRPHLVGR